MAEPQGKNPFVKKNVPSSVEDELKARSSTKGTIWAATRFPWIHISSLCNLCVNGFLNNTVKAGKLTSLSNRNSLYEDGYSRPRPVVTGLDIKKQGELGTTRKAVFKVTAFTDEQLNELQLCYFIPGMGCRVEWGWSVDAQGRKSPGPLGGSNGINDMRIPDDIANAKMKSIARANTHYDGFQGIITNFNYSLTSENTWDCVVEVVGAAELFSGSKVNDNGSKDCNCTVSVKTEEEGKEEIVKKSLLFTFFKQLFDDFEKTKTTYLPQLAKITGIDGKVAVIEQYTYLGPQRDERGGDDSRWYEGGVPGALFGNKTDATEAYISWATLEAAINALCIPTADKEGLHFPLGRLTSTRMRITYHPALESTDPRVCILPGTKEQNVVAQQGTVYNGKITASGLLTAGQVFGTISNLITAATANLTPPAGFGGPEIYLDDMMVNTVFLMMELDAVEKGDGSLSTFLTNVLAKINEACGSLWHFEIVSTTEDSDIDGKGPTLSVIDAKIFDVGPKTLQIQATTKGDNRSIVRNLTLNMKMTDAMKTQALYSNAKPQSAKSPGGGACGPVLFQPFGLFKNDKGTFNAATTIYSTSKPQTKYFLPGENSCDCKNANQSQEPEPTFKEIFANLGEEVNSTTCQAARTALEKAYSKSVEEGEYDHCRGLILPLDFNITLDGIGGFAFGQLVSCDRTPIKIRDNYDWQVTAVEHSITANDWTTTVNTVPRFKE